MAPLVVTLSARPAWARDVVNGSLGNYSPNTDVDTSGQTPVVYGEPTVTTEPETTGLQ